MIKYPCVCSDEEQHHEYVSERPNFDKIALVTPVFYTISCTGCRLESEIPKEDWDAIAKDETRASQRSRRVSRTKYPYHEPHTGILVKSKEHREEVLKHCGFHKAEHGIDERHNDELADKLKSNRTAMEDRRKAIRKKRETLIREGVIKPPKKRRA